MGGVFASLFSGREGEEKLLLLLFLWVSWLRRRERDGREQTERQLTTTTTTRLSNHRISAGSRGSSFILHFHFRLRRSSSCIYIS